MTSYRYPGEQVLLFLTLVLVSLLLLLTAGLSVCVIPLLLVFVVFYAYQANLAHHQMLLQKAMPIDSQKSPGLSAWFRTVPERSSRDHFRFIFIPAVR